MSSTSSESGAVAERKICGFLESGGYRIVSTNFKTRFGEIDIVAEDDSTVVLVEVKYRKDESFSPIEETLTRAKRKKMLMAGRAAAERFGTGKNVRFDFVAVLGVPDNLEIRHYQNVMESRF